MTQENLFLPLARSRIEDGIRSGHHLGAQLYVSLDTEPLADLAIGEAQPGRLLTPEMLLPWLSSGKPLTAAAIARLWEAGHLDLDDLVSRHIPEFGTLGKEAITVRHLLTHTAGLRRLGLPWPKSSWEEIIAWICNLRLEAGWVPGEKAGYNQAITWFLLGEIVQRLSGKPLASYLRGELLIPLGMSETWMGMPEPVYEEFKARLAPIFDTSDSPAQAHPWTRRAFLVNPSPGRSAIGPMRQLGRFYEALLSASQPSFPDESRETPRWSGPAILSTQTIDAMTARHRVGLEDRTFGQQLDWGLGFIIDSKHYGPQQVPYGYGPLASRRTFGHSGYQSSTGFADPEHGLVVALAFNGTPGPAPHEIRVHRVLEAVYTDLGLAD